MINVETVIPNKISRVQRRHFHTVKCATAEYVNRDGSRVSRELAETKGGSIAATI